MATFQDDFASASGTATDSAPTAISGWTAQFASGSTGFQSATIQTASGTVSGNVMRLADTGWGAAMMIRPTTIGNVSANTATEVLIGWRTSTGVTSSTAVTFGPGQLRTNTANINQHYTVGSRVAAGVETQQLWYNNAGSEWVSIGATKTVTTDYTPGDWWWTRLQVDGSGNWLWRTWADGGSEPGTWQNASAADTTVTGGYAGFGLFSTAFVIDVQWFSLGTGADSAPSPSGGGGSTELPPFTMPPMMSAGWRR